MSTDELSSLDAISLSDERDFLSRSLADLEREHAAGDVEDSDYESLRVSYTARLASTLRSIEALGDNASTGQITTPLFRARRFLGRRGTRKFLVITALGCFVVAIALVASEVAGVRLPGDQLSGSTSVPTSAQVEEELARAAVLGNDGQLSSAIALYSAVLQAVPNQPVALCYRGWLERLSGLAAKDHSVIASGDASLERAVAVAPTYPDARALYGVALFEDRADAKAAVEQFAKLAKLHPSAAIVAGVRQRALAAYRSVRTRAPGIYSRST